MSSSGFLPPACLGRPRPLPPRPPPPPPPPPAAAADVSPGRARPPPPTPPPTRRLSTSPTSPTPRRASTTSASPKSSSAAAAPGIEPARPRPGGEDAKEPKMSSNGWRLWFWFWLWFVRPRRPYWTSPTFATVVGSFPPGGWCDASSANPRTRLAALAAGDVALDPSRWTAAVG